MENGANAFLASIDGESSKDFCGHACLVKYEHSKKKGEGDIEIIEAPVGSGPKQKAASHTMSKKQRIITCTWCQAKKSNFDMIERLDVNNKSQLFCTLDCLSLYRVPFTGELEPERHVRSVSQVRAGAVSSHHEWRVCAKLLQSQLPYVIRRQVRAAVGGHCNAADTEPTVHPE